MTRIKRRHQHTLLTCHTHILTHTLLHGFRTPDRPARSESLHRPSYPGPQTSTKQ